MLWFGVYHSSSLCIIRTLCNSRPRSHQFAWPETHRSWHGIILQRYCHLFHSFQTFFLQAENKICVTAYLAHLIIFILPRTSYNFHTLFAWRDIYSLVYLDTKEEGKKALSMQGMVSRNIKWLNRRSVTPTIISPYMDKGHNAQRLVFYPKQHPPIQIILTKMLKTFTFMLFVSYVPELCCP